MSFYTEQAKSFKFPSLPGTSKGKSCCDNNKKEAAFTHGFVSAVLSAQLSPYEKVAWLKYAAEMPPGGPGGPGGGDIQPVEGPGPGFVPEQGGEPGGEGGDVSPEEIQQILASLPGNSIEEKLHNAVMALANMQHEGQEGPGQEGAEQGGPGGGAGGIDPALLQHLMSGAGGPGGPGNPGGPGGPQ